MSPEEQRIALAEWAGWKYVENNPSDKFWQQPDGSTNGVKFWANKDHPNIISYLPDYLHDLNAVHALEKRLKGFAVNIYGKELRKIVERDTTDELGSEAELWHATAAQRCEALLKTLNLWKGDQ
ncbi:hypothetical protein [Cerasicoccus frondis]|uniref:hypothetical protein n=1 Tax=Cerasicoccus frondis TaxID=490090 RepID=UPI002852D4B2|nr:hypothetical protein [Cerasicoccus frondis]